jgi:TolA-binding protein
MLRPRKKLYKREIKEDSLVTAYFNAQQWYHKNGDRLLMAVGALAVVLAVVFFVMRSKRGAEAAAAYKLGATEFVYYSGNSGDQTLQDLQAIVDKYSGTRSAGIAAFDLASAYYSQKNYASAEKYYRLVVDKYGNDPMTAVSGYNGLAACLESQNQYAEAAKVFTKIQKQYPKWFAAPRALYDAARCYALAGDASDAKAAYQAIIDRYPESSFVHDAKALSASL